MNNPRLMGVLSDQLQAEMMPMLDAIRDPLRVIKAEQPFVYELIVRKWGTQELAEALARMMVFKTEGRRVLGRERRREPRGAFSMPVATALMDIVEIHEQKFGFETTSQFGLV